LGKEEKPANLSGLGSRAHRRERGAMIVRAQGRREDLKLKDATEVFVPASAYEAYCLPVDGSVRTREGV
jgi:hypothetical protein